MKKSWGTLLASVALVAMGVLTSMGPVGAIAPPLAVTSITPNELAADITNTVVVRGNRLPARRNLSFRDDGIVPALPSTVVGARVVSPTQITALVHSPASVQYGTAGDVRAARGSTLDAAYDMNPRRFCNRRPTPPKMPTIAWINKPTITNDAQKKS